MVRRMLLSASVILELPFGGAVEVPTKDWSLMSELPSAEQTAVSVATASKEPLRPSVANKNQRNFVVFQTGFRSLARRSFVNIGCALGQALARETSISVLCVKT